MERWSMLIVILVCMQRTIHSSVQVTLFPRGPFYTSAPGGNVTFNCLSILSHDQIVDVVWLLNGSQLRNNTHENITDTFSENLGIGTLHFIHIHESYNNTKIQCEAVLFNTNIILSSNFVVLHLLSGFLLPVRSLNATVENYIISLTWTPPQNVQSNVTYCVDFLNSTSTILSSLHSICNITETDFNYPLPSRSWCDVFFISVTPVNAVGNGTRHTIANYSLVQSPPVIRDVIRLPRSNMMDTNTIQLWTLIMSERVCNGEVTFVYFNTGEIFNIGGANLSISENNITCSTEELTVNPHYSVIVTASNIAGSNTSYSSTSTELVYMFPPRSFISTPGGSATFYCITLLEEICEFRWIVNGSLLNQNITNDNIIISRSNHFRGRLNFIDIPLEYNMTTIKCEVVFTNGERETTGTILLLQGLLSMVGSLGPFAEEDSTIHLNWTAPITLDITGVDPDITYCVDVINSTTSLMLNSTCGINATELLFPKPPESVCTIILFTVTPVNPAGNGSKATESFMGTEIYPELMGVLFAAASTSRITGTYILIMTAPVCTLSVNFADFSAEEIIIVGGTDLTVEENNITFATELLTANHFYDGIVRASNAAGSSTSYFSISTHDVTGAVVVERNGIEVTALYSDHSSASGALFSFVFITESGDVDFTRSALLPLDENASHNYTLPFNLYPGHYRIYVYDIEQDGTLDDGVGYPAVTEELFTSGNGQGPPSYVNNCQIGTFPRVIMAECPLPHGTLQVIAQLIDVSEVHKLYVNQSMDLQTPVTVQVERNGAYWVTIFTIMEGEWDVEYTEQVVVSDVSTHSIASTTNSIASTTNSTGHRDLPLTIVIVVAAVAVAVAVIAVLVFIIKHRGHSIRRTSSVDAHEYSVQNQKVAGNPKSDVYSMKEVYSKKEDKDKSRTAEITSAVRHIYEDDDLSPSHEDLDTHEMEELLAIASRNQGASISSTDSAQTMNKMIATEVGGELESAESGPIGTTDTKKSFAKTFFNISITDSHSAKPPIPKKEENEL